MDLFLKAAAAALLASVLGLVIVKQGKDMTVLIVIAVCCMVLGVAITYLRPVLDFLRQLQNIGNLNNVMVLVLLKVTGIGLLTEIAAMICCDAGNASMGKALQILGTAVILWLSLPIFTELLALIQKILEDV